MSRALPITEVAGQKLSPEQRAYLEGLFAGLKDRGLTFAEVEPNSATATAKPNLDALIFEERVKQELHRLMPTLCFSNTLRPTGRRTGKMFFASNGTGCFI